jgi:hypothetical protein
LADSVVGAPTEPTNGGKSPYKNVELHVVSVIEASHAQICDVIGEERNKERRDSD